MRGKVNSKVFEMDEVDDIGDSIISKSDEIEISRGKYINKRHEENSGNP